MEKHLPHSGVFALVTGAGRRERVGAAVALALARRGANILLHYRTNQTEAEAVKNRIEAETGVEVRLVTGDLTRPEEVEKLFEVVPQIVVNNAAAFAPAKGDTLAAHAAALEGNVSANLHAPFLVANEAARRMQQAGMHGVIVFIGDAFLEAGGTYPFDKAAYAASKAAVGTLVRHFATAYGTHGIRSFAVLNGPVEPPPGAPERAVRSIAAEINLPADALSPWLTKEAVAHDIALLTELSTLNGTSVALDGGRAWLAPDEHA